MSTPRTNRFIDLNHEYAMLLKGSPDRRSESFDTCLRALVALIKRLAADKTIECATELSRLAEVISSNQDTKNIRWLLPTIRTALATRVEALIELEYGDLDACLDTFAKNLCGLGTDKAFESIIGLQCLREQIKKKGGKQSSRWLLGSIDAALGKKVIFFWR